MNLPKEQAHDHRASINVVSDSQLLLAPNPGISVMDSDLLRRILDCAVSGFALILLLPLLITVSCFIIAETGMPVIFSQNRVGRSGVIFRLFKFRTMRHGTTGPSVTVGGDKRVTRVGKILRKFKLDELPQLWNVMRGEMALVGSRPEVPEFVNVKDPIWESILSVRPGITHPASIAFLDEEELLAMSDDPIRYYRETLLPAKLAINLEYLKKRSLWYDLGIIRRTAICAVFPGKHLNKQARLQAKLISQKNLK